MSFGEWDRPAPVVETNRRCAGGGLVRAHQAWLALLACAGVLTLLVACGQENRFVAPPPPKVIVQLPAQQTVTPYLEATGNAASVNTVKLLARVQGYVQEIKYQDGAAVKKGTPLFVIEPEPYKVQLEQAQAAEEGAKATLTNAEAEFTRQQELQSKDVSTQANLDRARAARDTARASVLQARGMFENAKQGLLPGYFARVRVPLRPEQALLVQEVAVGSDQAGRYVLTVNADSIVEQRRVQLGQTSGEMRVIESGLKPDERVVVSGILDAVPGQKVDPQLQTPKSAAAEPTGSK